MTKPSIEVTQVTNYNTACCARVCDWDGQIRGQSKNRTGDYIVLSQYKSVYTGLTTKLQRLEVGSPNRISYNFLSYSWSKV
jgi:hypothetical protein